MGSIRYVAQDTEGCVCSSIYTVCWVSQLIVAHYYITALIMEVAYSSSRHMHRHTSPALVHKRSEIHLSFALF